MTPPSGDEASRALADFHAAVSVADEVGWCNDWELATLTGDGS